MTEETLVPYELVDESLETAELSAQTTAHLMRYIGAYHKIKQKSEEFKEQKAEVDDFYRNKQHQIENALIAIKSAVEAYLTYHTQQSLATPRGTAYFQTGTKVDWDETTALAWALAHESEHPELIRIKKELNKDAYRKLWESGVTMPGIATHSETSMIIKKA